MLTDVKNIPQVPCRYCNGQGSHDDPVVVGRNKRLQRKKARIGLREAAEKMGISASYLSDMELGRRPFTEQMAELFDKAIQ